MNKEHICAILLIFCFMSMTFSPTVKTTLSAASLKVYKSSEGNFVVETDMLKVIVEELLQNRYRIICIQQDGNQTEFEIVVANSLVLLYFNDTEVLRFPIKENSLTSPVSSEFVTTETKKNYVWDSIYFVEGQYIKYPHPDRDFYGISPFSYWQGTGKDLYHCQFDQATSKLLNTGGPAVIGAAIGGVIGLLVSGPVGGVISAIAGAVIVVVLTWITDVVFLDELDCMWWWISQAYVQWLADNAGWLVALYLIYAPAVIVEATSAFLSCGYLRVGSATFYDAIGVGKLSLGDINGDGKIDSIDLSIVYNNLGSNPGNPACDLNHDGKVNYEDLGLEFGYYLGWQTRYYTYAPPIETTATAFGQAINHIRQKYP
jgi:hypothetical protein